MTNQPLINDDYIGYILRHFHYHKDGTITRDDVKGGCGSKDKDGYLILKIKGKQFKAHRVAWLLNYGAFPSCELDHINRNRTDNRIENLRESNRIQQCNNATRKVNKDTGVVGISLDKSTKGLLKRFTFRVMGKTYRYRTLEEAMEAKKCIKSYQLRNLC